MSFTLNFVLLAFLLICFLQSESFAAKSTTKKAKVDDNYDIICPVNEIKKFDDTVAKIVSFGKEQRQFPSEKTKIQSYCRATKSDHLSLEKSVEKCLRGASKNFAKLLVHSLGATIKTYCNLKSKRRQNEILLMAACMNKDIVQSQAATQLSRYREYVKRGTIANPLKNRVGYGCCYYFKLLSQMETMMQKSCTDKQVKAVIDFVRNLIQSLIDVACMDFTDASDACDHLPPPPEGKFRSIYPNSTSFIVPLVELFANLERP